MSLPYNCNGQCSPEGVMGCEVGRETRYIKQRIRMEFESYEYNKEIRRPALTIIVF
jgi:hypothetical protein